MNALKHGLRARELLTPDESAAEYEAFRNNALASLQPVEFLETELAEKIINTRLRLRRCDRIEAGLLGGGKRVMEEIVQVLRNSPEWLSQVSSLRTAACLKYFSAS